MWNLIKNIFNKKEKVKIKLNKNKNCSLKKNIQVNLDMLKEILAESDDLVIREFYITGKRNKAVLIYLSSIVNTDLLQKDILKPLMTENEIFNNYSNLGNQVKDFLSDYSIPIGEVEVTKKTDKCVESILSGKCILFINESPNGFILDVKGWEGRPVQAPAIESTSTGPQEAFNENIKTNISLIRTRLKDNNLAIKMKKIGNRTHTDLALVYIDDIADKKIVDKINERLSNIDVDGVLSTGQINQYLEDNWVSIFPQFQTTERPDKAVANILEGKIIIILNGTPFISIMPTTFLQFFQSPEDYYDKFYVGTFLRILRIFAAFVTVSLPAIYISLVSYHHELIPKELAMTISKVRQDVPFPSYLEALIMEISLEFLREAGLRVPGPIGQTIGIVGGLILGEAAVSAGIVSPPMVIIVGFTAIASFIIPSNAAAIPLRLLRFPMMVMATVFSVYGIMIGWLAILIHLCSLESLEQPYFAPFGPIIWADMKDSIIRAPLRLLSNRPLSIPGQQKDRQDRYKKEAKDE